MSEKENSITKTYDLMKWTFHHTAKYPKTYRYGLGSRIEEYCLCLLELQIEAVYSRDKINNLRRANILLEKLRYLFRFSADMKVISIKSYEYGVRELDIIGKYIGAWINSIQKK